MTSLSLFNENDYNGDLCKNYEKNQLYSISMIEFNREISMSNDELDRLEEN
jgi:hypothetical protein